MTLIAISIVGLLFVMGAMVYAIIALMRAAPRTLKRVNAALKSPRKFAESASAQGWTYAEHDPSLLSLCSGYPFDRPPGQLSEIREVLRGPLLAHDLVIFQYVPNTGEPISIWAVSMPQALPDISVRLRNPSDHVNAEQQLGQPISLGDAALDARYWIEADDQAYVRSLLLSPMVRKLLTASDPIAWRIAGNQLLSWKQESRYEPGRLLKHADRVVKIAKAVSPAIPQHGSPPPPDQDR